MSDEYLDEEYLDPRAAAAHCGLSRRWMELARHIGNGPPFVRVTPRMIRYRRSDLDQWMRERTHRSTSEYATADDAA